MGPGLGRRGAGLVIRLLRDNAYASSFWTRSSADGRFVSHGGSSGAAGATVIDLVQDREIPADAFYDPGFFPDNSGFIIQGSGGSFCRQSLLTASPTRITFNEPECTQVPGVGLYQHLGAVRGGDYWTVHGQFTSDDGGHGLTSNDPPADFDGSAEKPPGADDLRRPALRGARHHRDQHPLRGRHGDLAVVEAPGQPRRQRRRAAGRLLAAPDRGHAVGQHLHRRDPGGGQVLRARRQAGVQLR